MTRISSDQQINPTNSERARSSSAQTGMPAIARGLALGLSTLICALSLTACGGGDNNCGSEGQSRDLHCAP